MEQKKKKVIPEVEVHGNEFRVVVDEAPDAETGAKLLAEKHRNGAEGVGTDQTGVDTETVVKTGRIPQHSWGL